ncbi:endonuclease/exonuclease/phosphatase family protein [Tichowtungia aerotolerans]|uniref:Endonuclease n=1 Tax=Tichowtungia aerotolerans TaxID=2697043 RepID=A0A6P1M7N2_9BACT|nr:endonuclease/exonuclease/phosphatase family protein [Tichowtungia aerotolerans]QHI70729.1 endonuclease [Tichowtungia aerotolerans]
MRFVLYNIRYGTGGGKIQFPLQGYLGRNGKTLEEISGFLHELNPDVAGLVEVDAGSYRTRKTNQAETLAKKLGHYHVYRSKYGKDSFSNRLPVLNQQGNAFIVRDSGHQEKFHYFDRGMKRLVIELEMDDVVFFLIHLPLGSRLRHRQLGDLYELIKEIDKPCVVAGDFNALWGEQEVRLFLAATQMKNAHAANSPTFPSWKPKRHLDFIFHSPGIEVERCWMPKVLYSDHLPIVCDFSIL